MFFSTDLLAHKSGPFRRIWLLGCSSKKLNGQDLKLDVSKIAEAIQEWVCHQDSRRLSLALSATLAFGVVRTVREQMRMLHRDAFKVEVELAKVLKLVQGLNDNQLDLTADQEAVANIDLSPLDEAVIDDNMQLQLNNETSLELLRQDQAAQLEQITMREFDFDNGKFRLEEEEDDDNFGENPAAVTRRPITENLFDDDLGMEEMFPENRRAAIENTEQVEFVTSASASASR